MNVPERLEALVGSWTGTSRLWRPWLSPDERVQESESTAAIALAVRDKFATITYTWSVDGEPQEGLLVLRYQHEHKTVSAVWVDSWHMSEEFMLCHGSVDDAGIISMLGSYAAPPGPDWGWRTTIALEAPKSWRLVMYNVPPDQPEEIAFELRYSRPTA